MPRKPRFILPGQPQHVIIHGVNREPIFYRDTDYHSYHTHRREAIEKHGCELHAFVSMTNHVHLLVTPAGKNSIAKSIQSLGRYYVRYFNESSPHRHAQGRPLQVRTRRNRKLSTALLWVY